MALTLDLPRAASLVDELLVPAPELSAEELAGLRNQVQSELAPLVAELPPGERLVLDTFRHTMALRRPERCTMGEEPFVPSPAVCRRSVGLAAVEQCLRRRAAGPVQAVAQVLQAGAEDVAGAEAGAPVRAPWWARWYAGLGPGGRAAVAAEATTWATQLWTALDWERLPPPVVVGGRDDWWDLPGRRLALRSRADVRARVQQRSALVVLGGGAPDGASRTELAFCALVSALSGGARGAPGRVLGVWPASGQVRLLEVDGRVLQAAAQQAVAAAATWVDALIERDLNSR